MAPEQWRGKKQGTFTDQYSLAVLFCELIQGEVPFKSAFDSADHEIMRDVVISEQVEPLKELTKKQNAVLLRALSKEPEDRFGSCAEFVEALAKGRTGSKLSKSAIFNRKSAMLLAFLAAVGFGVFKFGEHTDARPLRPTIKKNVQESAVHEAKVDGEMAVEELEKEISDLGQGFGEKIERLKRDLRIAQAMYGSKSWDKAYAAFKGVEVECSALRTLEGLRQEAVELKKEMEKQRRGAEAKSAQTLAKKEWKKGVGVASVAAQSFETAQFPQASKGWKNAAKMFKTSKKMATAISLYRKAKKEWDGRMSNVEQGISNSDIEKYASVEWTAAERSARLGAEVESDPVRGKAHYIAALASFKKAVENAVPRMVPKMKWTATLNGREVAATLKIGNKTFTLPETIKFQKDQSYTTSLSYSGCKSVSTTLTADWNGLKEKRVTLEEEKLFLDLVEVSGATTANSAQKRAVAQTSLPLEVKSRKTDIAFRLVPAGTFIMGSPYNESGREDDEKQHSVAISKPFYCGKFEVTQAQWKQVMGTSPSRFQGSENPVEQVSWDDCQMFLKKLCDLEGVPQGTYRLLTEAQWEYACRAGTTTPFCYGNRLDSMKTNFDGDYPYGGASKNMDRQKTMNVGQFKPNAWGMCDMHGNVWEWCSDLVWDYPSGSVTDPTGITSGSDRVRRGGSWYDSSWFCRSANRSWNTPSFRNFHLGFRLLRTAPNLP